MSDPTQPDGAVPETVDDDASQVLDNGDADREVVADAPPEAMVDAEPKPVEQVTDYSSEAAPGDADIDQEEAPAETASEEVPVREPMEDPRELRIRALEGLLLDKEKTLHDYIRAYKKTQTDLEAFKERLQREHSEEVFAAQAKSTEALIEVLDNLQLSLDAAQQGGSVESVSEGVQIVTNQFRAVLDQQGLEEISPTGQPFDPAYMEAMSVLPVTDPAQDNMVLATLKPGYRIGEREVRPALVQVGRKTG